MAVYNLFIICILLLCPPLKIYNLDNFEETTISISKILLAAENLHFNSSGAPHQLIFNCSTKYFQNSSLFNENYVPSHQEINCNFSYLLDGSRDFLCFFAPSVVENFTNTRKHTRLKLGESFQEYLIPILFLQVLSKHPWCTFVFMDGVGRQNFSSLRSLILWVMITVIVSRCTYYQSQRFRRQYRVLICKRLKMSLRLLLIKQKLSKLCRVKTVYSNPKTSYKVSESHRNKKSGL